MSQENVETVLRAYEGVNARLEAPRDLYDPDVAASTVPLVYEMRPLTPCQRLAPPILASVAIDERHVTRRDVGLVG